MSSPQSPQDSYAIWQSRVSSNWPSLSLSDQMHGVAFAQGILSDNQDIRVALTQSAPNQSVLTATGPALDAILANNGIQRIPATSAIVSLTFTRANPADTSTITIQAGTVVGSPGDGLTVTPQGFSTNSTVTISGTGQTATVLATATAPGSGGNVAPNTVTQPVVATGTGVAWTVTNPPQGTGGALGYTTAGTDGETAPNGVGDTLFRNRGLAALAPIYSSAAVINAMLGVPGVTSAYVVDPQNGNGTITYYWGQADGTTPGLSGSTITAGTLAATVDTAVRGVLSSNLVPTASAFTVTAVTNVTVTFSAPASYATATATPLIQQAIVSYVNGLPQGQAPTTFGLTAAMNAATGGILTNATVTSTTPSPLTAAATTEFRMSGTPSALVTVTRV